MKNPLKTYKRVMTGQEVKDMERQPHLWEYEIKSNKAALNAKNQEEYNKWSDIEGEKIKNSLAYKKEKEKLKEANNRRNKYWARTVQSPIAALGLGTSVYMLKKGNKKGAILPILGTGILVGKIEHDRKQIEKQAMEKIASRAWKKFLPKLSDANYKKLVDAGIYNKDRELRGLRRGTQNILRKENAKLVSNARKAGAANAELYKKDFMLEKGKVPSAKTIERYKKEPAKNMASDSLITEYKPTSSVLGRGRNHLVFVPKNEHNVAKSTAINDRLSRRDRDGRKWNQALTERHEADEIRYGNRLIEKSKKKGTDPTQAMYSINGGAHISPKVIAQESANVAVAPRSIKKNVFRELRQSTGEDVDIGKRTGIPYGSSGVYNKAAARKAEKSVINSNMEEASKNKFVLKTPEIDSNRGKINLVRGGRNKQQSVTPSIAAAKSPISNINLNKPMNSSIDLTKGNNINSNKPINTSINLNKGMM